MSSKYIRTQAAVAKSSTDDYCEKSPGSLEVKRVSTAAERAKVITVLRAIYLQEKGWVNDPASQIPDQDLGREDISWFVALQKGGGWARLR